MMQTMASRFMTDPSLRSSVTSMMQGIIGDNGAAAGTADATDPTVTPTGNVGASASSVSMDGLLRMGQQFAQQMQQTNPELVTNLRSQMQNMNSQTDGQNPPPSNPPPNN